MNKVLIIGRLVREPNISTTTNGFKRAFFTVAADRRSADNQTDYVPCTAWRTDAEFIEKYLDKGALVSVEGRFTSSDIKQADGSIQTRYEVTVERIQGLETKAQVEARKQSKTQEISVKSINNPSQSHTREIKFEEESKSNKEKEDFNWDFEV